ncbi:MAG: exodeoxyribonuclease VII large subunit [Betaproteobacteria bacterium]|nr:MAG: exodeoxyribonuclease VII large subunit [Betaproteobacteria bacterium]
MADLNSEVISVGELNRRTRQLIERAVPVLWVAGEVSNLTRAPSGHWYFTLKDATASVRCAMFKGRNQSVDFVPNNGDQVEVRAQATLYEARGEFQLGVDAMRRAGLGNLFEAFLKLKAKLEAEGLFDPASKRPIPAYPHAIGIITSPRAAALRDVLITLKRRWPNARVILYPCLVQGAGAAAQIRAAVITAGQRHEVDTLLLVRGGGSIEDLWAYNDEALARAIAASPIPVISGVGHETDFTLADFCADLRAATPTAAAEHATPDGIALGLHLKRLARGLRDIQQRQLEHRSQRVDHLAQRLRHPASQLAANGQRIAHLKQRMSSLLTHRLNTARLRYHAAQHSLPRPQLTPLMLRIESLHQRMRHQIDAQIQQKTHASLSLAAQLRQLNPQAVLERGYSIVRDSAGHLITDARTLQPGDRLDLTFAHGQAKGRVE